VIRNVNNENLALRRKTQIISRTRAATLQVDDERLLGDVGSFCFSALKVETSRREGRKKY
jgi:hypothetical protein